MIAEIDAANQAKPKAERVSLQRACDALGVSAGGYYAWRTRVPSKRAIADAELAVEVKTRHLVKKRRYGIRRLRADLTRRGRRHGEARLRRLARAQGLSCAGSTPGSRGDRAAARG